MIGAKRRVVITGFGAITPFGNTAESLWDALRSGRSGVRTLERLPGKVLPTAYGAEAREFTGSGDDFGPLAGDLKRNIRKGLKLMCREIQMGVAAAQRTLVHAGLQPDSHAPERIGVVYGSDYIMTDPEEFTAAIRNCLGDDGAFHFERWGEGGLPQVQPLWLLKYLPNMPASHIAIYNDFRGPNNSLTLREAASNSAIAEAYTTIARGSADAMLAGATGTRIQPIRTVHVSLQEQLATNGFPAEQLSRPFDRQRTGMVLGEGAGAVLLEELGAAQARGAKIWGEVVGYGSSSARDQNGVARCDVAITNALNQGLCHAGLSPADLGHIHAHGLSTRKCDAEEARAIRNVLGGHALLVPVTAAKSYFGNLGAGGGVVELIASLLALDGNWLFPVLNYETPDPDCEIAVAARPGLSPGDSFANLSVTPQGQASVIVVRRAT